MFPRSVRKTFFDKPAELARKETRPGPGQHDQKRVFDNKLVVDYSKRFDTLRSSANDYTSEIGPPS